jgi:hypothetical protein
MKKGNPLLIVILFLWTATCALMMWREGIQSDDQHPIFGNLPGDLPFDLACMAAESLLFWGILRPGSYRIRSTSGRAVVLLPLLLVGCIFHMFQLMHAGSVHGWMFLWMVSLLCLDLGLLLTKLVLAISRRSRP